MELWYLGCCFQECFDGSWKLEGVAAANSGSFGGLSEVRFLSARLLKETGT